MYKVNYYTLARCDDGSIGNVRQHSDIWYTEQKIENDVGVPIGEIVFDNVDGLENLISILKILKKRVYRDNHFYKKMLP